MIGFDDIYATNYTTPALTTIRQPFFEMGQTAVRLLLDRLGGREIASAPVFLPTTLVVRESAGAPAAIHD